MSDLLYSQRRRLEQQERESLRAYQLVRLNELLSEILPSNPFYASKLADMPPALNSLDQLQHAPLTSKDELVAAEAGELPRNRTYPESEYARLHRTSGTRGRPLTILDTADDWRWWIDTWQYVLDAAQVTAADRALMAFSFGPFIGFWSAYDALAHRGVMVIPAGGLTTRGRLDLLMELRATVLCCTPTYALRMQEVAGKHGLCLAESAIRCIIVAGEPGGSLPSVRNRIETAWAATVIDHSGATEVGPWGYANTERTGLHVAESEFIAEFVPPDIGTLASSVDSSHGPRELVLTALGRRGMPVIRYRTGDLVQPTYPSGPNRFVLLSGGVLGRADDMVVIRGVNIYPSSVEEILRRFETVGEFRITVRRSGALDELQIELEDQTPAQLRQISEQFQRSLGLRVVVESVPADHLPRFESKSNRFVDLR